MDKTLPRLGAVRKDRVGTGLVWLAGAALGSQLVLVVGLLCLLVANGLGYFWQRPLGEIELSDGTKLHGEVHDEEPIVDRVHGEKVLGTREKLKIGNRDVYGLDFKWIDRAAVTSRTFPKELVSLERLEYGNFLGRLAEVRRDGATVTREPDACWRELREALPKAALLHERIARIEKGPQGALNTELSRARLAVRRDRKSVV